MLIVHVTCVCYLYIINPPAPTPCVSLSSTTVRLPSVSPYNTLTLTCTATLPVPRDMLTASLSFTWLKGSSDVTSSSSSSDPLTSTLTRQETTPSTLTYTCRYSVVVSGDTPYTADTSATVTVTGEILRTTVHGRILVDLIKNYTVQQFSGFLPSPNHRP